MNKEYMILYKQKQIAWSKFLTGQITQKEYESELDRITPLLNWEASK